MKKYKLTLIFASMLVILRAVSLLGDIDKLVKLYRTDPTELPEPDPEPATYPEDAPDWM